MNVIQLRPQIINLEDFSSFTPDQIDDALGVIMDSDFVPKNLGLEAFRYDSDLARDLMRFVVRKEHP
ncbi:hypothetical protein P5704_024095 (plasmid) [Pseudomonas sp. FeN3W]|nr:hypothetical protein P5704_024095 [Pseudomonas sp. FeN3W]